QAPAAARAAGSAHAGAGVVLGERVARGGDLGGIALLEHRVRILLHVLHRCLEVVLPSGEVLGELLGRVLLRGGDQIEPGLCVLDGVHTGDQRGVDDGGGAGVGGEGGAVLVGPAAAGGEGEQRGGRAEGGEQSASHARALDGDRTATRITGSGRTIS